LESNGWCAVRVCVGNNSIGRRGRRFHPAIGTRQAGALVGLPGLGDCREGAYSIHEMNETGLDAAV
jgi:hypothetical protein